MKKVFNKIKAECYVCGTPLNGAKLLTRGNRYYCPSDYEKTSHSEKTATKRVKDKIDEYKRQFR